MRPLHSRENEDDLLQRYIELLTATGFALPTEFPARPLGRIIPSRDAPTIVAGFAAYWSRMQSDFTSFQQQTAARLNSLAVRGNADQFGVLAGKACHERRFFTTVDKRMRLCPRDTRISDSIVILFGDSVPYVLRKKNAGSWMALYVLWKKTAAKWSFWGECYAEGIMFGEAESLKEEQIYRLV